VFPDLGYEAIQTGRTPLVGNSDIMFHSVRLALGAFARWKVALPPPYNANGTAPAPAGGSFNRT
jgi:hypothetical protein